MTDKIYLIDIIKENSIQLTQNAFNAYKTALTEVVDVLKPKISDQVELKRFHEEYSYHLSLFHLFNIVSPEIGRKFMSAFQVEFRHNSHNNENQYYPHKDAMITAYDHRKYDDAYIRHINGGISLEYSLESLNQSYKRRQSVHNILSIDKNNNRFANIGVNVPIIIGHISTHRLIENEEIKYFSNPGYRTGTLRSPMSEYFNRSHGIIKVEVMTLIASIHSLVISEMLQLPQYNDFNAENNFTTLLKMSEFLDDPNHDVINNVITSISETVICHTLLVYLACIAKAENQTENILGNLSKEFSQFDDFVPGTLSQTRDELIRFKTTVLSSLVNILTNDRGERDNDYVFREFLSPNPRGDIRKNDFHRRCREIYDMYCSLTRQICNHEIYEVPSKSAILSLAKETLSMLPSFDKIAIQPYIESLSDEKIKDERHSYIPNKHYFNSLSFKRSVVHSFMEDRDKKLYIFKYALIFSARVYFVYRGIFEYNQNMKNEAFRVPGLNFKKIGRWMSRCLNDINHEIRRRVDYFDLKAAEGPQPDNLSGTEFDSTNTRHTITHFIEHYHNDIRTRLDEYLSHESAELNTRRAGIYTAKSQSTFMEIVARINKCWHNNISLIELSKFITKIHNYIKEYTEDGYVPLNIPSLKDRLESNDLSPIVQSYLLKDTSKEYYKESIEDLENTLEQFNPDESTAEESILLLNTMVQMELDHHNDNCSTEEYERFLRLFERRVQPLFV